MFHDGHSVRAIIVPLLNDLMSQIPCVVHTT